MHADVTHRGALLPKSVMTDDAACNRLVNWIRDNCGDLAHRLTLLPQTTTPLTGNSVLRRFARTGSRVESYRSHGHSEGGPLLAAWPTPEDMARAISAVPRDQVVICLEWSESFEGWASAVGAYNAEIDQIQPPLEDDLAGEFEYLLMWDSEILEGAKRGRGRDRIHPTIRTLKDAGLSEQFVMTYALALGASGNVAEHIAKHYREV